MSGMSQTFVRLRRLVQTERGVAAIEFGLMAPFLVLLVVATVEMGTATYHGMKAQSAAEAGAIYASKYGLDTVGIGNAVVNATDLAGITATPAPSQFCGCPTAGGVTSISCSASCSDGSAPGQYVRISAQITREPLMTFPGLVPPITLTGESVVRMY
jgi:Flp pilus assembly protein TadG